jgi:zinc-binding alcohol dehydrogenase family protein
MTTEIRAIGQTAALPITSDRSLIDTIIPRPTPGSHDLLVEVRAVSVNPVDVKLRGGAEPDGGLRVLGFDASGTVVAIGDEVSRFAVGDEVFYAGAIDRPGSNAELQTVDERIVGRKPSSISHADAAALPLTAITAWEALFDKLRIPADAHGTLLMVGGAGGVGSIAIQLVRALLPNVRIIATASKPESAAWVRSLGAHEIVNHHGDLAAQVSDIEPDGIEWIFTTVSTGQLPVYVQMLRPFGQIVAIDDPKEMDVVSLKSKSLTWHWEFMFARSLHHAADMSRQHDLLNEVADLVDAQRVRTTVTTVLRPITAETMREAHRLVEAGVTGKVVVTNEPAAVA